jgi:hypothetical protein
MTPFSAVYEGGVLRPDAQLPLADGTRVQVTLGPADIPTPPDPRAVFELIRAAAAVPEGRPPVDDGLAVSENVDRILYGGPGGAR